MHTDSPDAALAGSAALGTSLHDRADVTGFVTGIPFNNSVNFLFYSDPAAGFCAGATVDKGSVAIVGTAPGIAHPSTSSGALGAGRAFQAVLASDANYNVNGQTGPVVGACEPFTVNKGALTLTTVLHNDTGDATVANNAHLALGSSLHDRGEVTGFVTGVPFANQVSFTFFNDPAAGACTSTSVAKGGRWRLSRASPGVAHPSHRYRRSGRGRYAFRASLTGDANYDVNGVAAGGAADSTFEPFFIDKANLTLTTTVHTDTPDAALAGNQPLGRACTTERT